MRVNDVDVLEELLTLFCLLDEKCAINMPKPYTWRVASSVDVLDFILFHKQVGHNMGNGRTRGCSMYLFKIVTLDVKIVVFWAELQQCNDGLCGL